ncbi:hypothetical protein EDB85DRAFT_149466 [Lactarius pseudohatsudake]|nr:hypothetical protein EDB85DRAFT_149466 [Lactarius pseudohatsudake]
MPCLHNFALPRTRPHLVCYRNHSFLRLNCFHFVSRNNQVSMSKSMTSATERRFRVTYHGTWSYLFLTGSCVRCTGSSVRHSRVLPPCSACQRVNIHVVEIVTSVFACYSLTHVLYMNVERAKFCDVDCVFGPISPCYGIRHPPRRPVNPSIHRHGRESRRAFVLSTWLIDARICGSRGLISRICVSDRIRYPMPQG